MALEVRWSTRLDEIAALEAPWRELEASAPGATLLASYDYLLPWYRHYTGRAGQPLVGSAWQGATLVGLAPLLARRGRVGGVPVDCIQFATEGGESGEFLLAEDDASLAGAFLDSLVRSARFHVARFNNLGPASAELDALRQAAARGRVPIETLPTSYATVDLRGGYEAYRGRLSPKFRGNLKRRARAMEAVGAIGVEGLHPGADPGALERDLDRMFAIADQSWKARRGGPMAEHHRGFYREIARRFASRGQLDLALLTIGGRDRAYMLGLADRGVYFDVTLSFDDSVRQLAPGIVLAQEVLRRLAAQGVHTFVSHGVHDYKRHFASALVPRRRALVFTRRPRAALSRALRFALAPLWRRVGLLPPLEARASDARSGPA